MLILLCESITHYFYFPDWASDIQRKPIMNQSPKETGYEIKLNMADEAKFQLLDRKIAVARRELNNLRSDMYSMKKMFVHKFKEVKEMVETGEVP